MLVQFTDYKDCLDYETNEVCSKVLQSETMTLPMAIENICRYYGGAKHTKVQEFLEHIKRGWIIDDGGVYWSEIKLLPKDRLCRNCSELSNCDGTSCPITTSVTMYKNN